MIRLLINSYSTKHKVQLRTILIEALAKANEREYSEMVLYDLTKAIEFLGENLVQGDDKNNAN